jgi:hypothetical protein
LYPNDIHGGIGPRDRGWDHYVLKDRNRSGGGEGSGIVIGVATIRHQEGRGVPKAEVIVIGFILLIGGAKDGRDRDGFPGGHARAGRCNRNGRELPQGLGGWKNE